MSAFAREVQTKFDSAKESKDLISYETTEVEKESGGMKVSDCIIWRFSNNSKRDAYIMQFVLILAPGLGQKTKEDKKEGGEKPNPFLKPNPALVVKELDEHIMLLNKFAVSPNHLLIVTKGRLCLYGQV